MRQMKSLIEIAREAAITNKNNDIMSTLENLLKKGKEEGLEKGLEKGLQKGMRKKEVMTIQAMHEEGCAIDFISRILKVNQDFVRKVIDGEITEDSI